VSKRKLAGVIAVCTAAIIVLTVLLSIRPWEHDSSAEVYALTTAVTPSGAGSVALSPAGGDYELNAQVTLIANPASGYIFDHWSGDASGTSTVVTVTMNSHKAATAHFEAAPPSGNLMVHFIDVGQGDAILLDLGDTEVLIDGGDKSPGVVNYISQYVDGPLEVMVATHPHADHIGGLIAVLNAFEVSKIILNGDTSTSQTYSQFMSAVNSEGADLSVYTRGFVSGLFTGTDNLYFNVLSPVDLNGTINNNSIVLSLSYGQVDFLFMGDAEQEAEASMLMAGIVRDVDILKVGHHGSSTASSIQFLQVAKPEVAIYMAGQGNSYGHPHQETIDNLCDIGAQIYGTDVHGTIVVTTDGATYNVLPSNNVPPVACEYTIIPPSPVDQVSLEIVSVTSPVSAGAYATLEARAPPGTVCTIAVYYKSGLSSAQGLYPKQTDDDGYVSWTWKVGARTTPGNWRIVVTATCEGQTMSQETYFTVSQGSQPAKSP
jgi:beta-lactamase superfamily II metal-dependent hydrolase